MGHGKVNAVRGFFLSLVPCAMHASPIPAHVWNHLAVYVSLRECSVAMSDWAEDQDPYEILGLAQGHENTEAQIKKVCLD